MRNRRLFVVVAACCATGLLVLATGAAGSHLDQPQKDTGPSANAGHDVSPPLRTIAPAPGQGEQKKEKEPKKGPPVPDQSGNDPVIQSTPGGASAPALGAGFEGIGDGLTGPQGTFSVNSAPPDPNAAVGPSYIFEVVNEDIAIFDKSGNVVYGPVPTNTLWSGFGGGCQSNDDGDATVKYDQLANRWIVSQFSVSTTPYLQCVAVSTSGDPTGTYSRYSFQYSNFPDYPKLGVWPDAYYTTFNMFKGNSFVGPEVCAYDRSAMLAGQAATQQCFTLGSSIGSLLPSDLDGPTAPPAGSPNYVMSFATNALQLWKFHVDWTTPANSTFTGPATIPVASFSPACGGGGACIPQAGTTQQLDSLADRLMYRLAYRNFGDHESLVVNDSVTAGSSVGVRWYELRDPNGTPTVFQQGTYAPDSSYRWMGSLAQDKLGDIGLGFSVSSSSLHPGIHVTGQLAGDAPGTMTQGETSVIDGAGSQTGSSLTRWGDYTSMAVDPSDDCTFWYTDEYIPSNGAFNWRTRIGSFKLGSCGASTGPDFSISASPASLTIGQGASSNSTISTAVTNGSAQSVGLSASGLPSGASASFSPISVTAGGSSTMTVSVGPATTPGNYTITVTGIGSSVTHTTSVSLTVTAPVPTSVVNGGFETGSLSGWTTGGVYTPRVVTTAHSGSYSAQLGSTGAVNGDSTLSQTMQIPTGTTQLSFWYQPHCPDTITYDQIQMQIRSLSGSTLANVLNVCSNSGAWTNVTYDMSSLAGQTVVLWFNDHDDGYPTDPTYFLLDDVTLGAYTPPPPDFSISASPSSLTVAQGASGNSTISTAVTTGPAQTVSLSASGLPSGAAASFNPTSVTAGGSSTMTVSVGSSTAPGTYTITVTGTGTSATHSATVSLTVQAPTPTFTLSATPSSRTVLRPGSTTYTVTITPSNGFSSSVSLSVSGLPGRTSTSFSPNPAASSSTLTVTTQSRTSRGTYTLTIKGTGGGLTRTTTVTFVVQ
jgi:hypothetical protein